MSALTTKLAEQFTRGSELEKSIRENFEERLGLLVDRETVERDNRRLKTRLRQARLRHQACIEDIDFKQPRGLDKPLIMRLAECSWLHRHQNMIITGPTGAGKSYLACAFAQKACRIGYTASYQRMPRLFEEINLAKGDGRYVKLMAGLAKVDLLVLDDFGLQPLNQEQRHGKRSQGTTSCGDRSGSRTKVRIAVRKRRSKPARCSE